MSIIVVFFSVRLYFGFRIRYYLLVNELSYNILIRLLRMFNQCHFSIVFGGRFGPIRLHQIWIQLKDALIFITKVKIHDLMFYIPL